MIGMVTALSVAIPVDFASAVGRRPIPSSLVMTPPTSAFPALANTAMTAVVQEFTLPNGQTVSMRMAAVPGQIEREFLGGLEGAENTDFVIIGNGDKDEAVKQVRHWAKRPAEITAGRPEDSELLQPGRLPDNFRQEILGKVRATRHKLRVGAQMVKEDPGGLIFSMSFGGAYASRTFYLTKSVLPTTAQFFEMFFFILWCTTFHHSWLHYLEKGGELAADLFSLGGRVNLHPQIKHDAEVIGILTASLMPNLVLTYLNLMQTGEMDWTANAFLSASLLALSFNTQPIDKVLLKLKDIGVISLKQMRLLAPGVLAVAGLGEVSSWNHLPYGHEAITTMTALIALYMFRGENLQDFIRRQQAAIRERKEIGDSQTAIKNAKCADAVNAESPKTKRKLNWLQQFHFKRK